MVKYNTRNVFKGAKFGDKFLTRNNKIWVFFNFEERCNKKFAFGWFEDNYFYYLLNGKCAEITIPKDHPQDIISRYQEPIDEEKLNELAESYANQFSMSDGFFKYATKEDFIEVSKKDFKAGYKKAMEE